MILWIVTRDLPILQNIWKVIFKDSIRILNKHLKTKLINLMLSVIFNKLICYILKILLYLLPVTLIVILCLLLLNFWLNVGTFWNLNPVQNLQLRKILLIVGLLSKNKWNLSLLNLTAMSPPKSKQKWKIKSKLVITRTRKVQWCIF